jgi:hypothetical protein
MKWNNITIYQLQEIHSCRDMSHIEKTMNTLAIVKDWSMDKVESMPIDELTNELKKLEFLNTLPTDKVRFSFRHRGRRWKLAKTTNEICGHHFIELQQVFNGDMIESLHKVMALLTYEVDFLGRTKKVTDAVFFSAVYPKLLETILTYLKEEMNQLKREA